jgi:S1-C subfamily serine protease
MIESKQMKCLMFAIAFALCAFAQPTRNVITRVFQIRYAGATGTAFVLDYEDSQYFVTADHMVATAGTKATVEIFGSGDSQWHGFEFTILRGGGKCADVAVLVPKEKRFVTADPIPYPYNFAIGQEVYFLGFPYGLYTSFGSTAAPLVKHAYLSASVSCTAIYPDGKKDEGLLLLDGLNNPGFSGGPVVAPDMFSPFTNMRALKLIGVISGFRSESSPLQVDGKTMTNAAIPTNTGIIVAIPIQRAIELIKTYVDKQK